MLMVQMISQEQRAANYRLLAGCYYFPADNFAEKLSKLEAQQDMKDRLFSCLAPENCSLENLQKEFSRLFLGPYKLLAPPYGSVYMDVGGLVNGPSTKNVESWYQTEGLHLTLKELPDHIAIEFEFMHYLICKEIYARQENHWENAERYQKKQKSFLQQYVAAWIPEFANCIQTHTTSNFYSELAKLTVSYIQSEVN